MGNQGQVSRWMWDSGEHLVDGWRVPKKSMSLGQGQGDRHCGAKILCEVKGTGVCTGAQTTGSQLL